MLNFRRKIRSFGGDPNRQANGRDRLGAGSWLAAATNRVLAAISSDPAASRFN